MTGCPCTRNSPATTVRPCAGSAGVQTMVQGASAACSAASSAPTLPRMVESSFLNHTVRPSPRSRAPAAPTRAAAALGATPRDWVLTTSTVPAAGGSAPAGLTTTVTGAPASTCTPLSMAPVRSSATMARAEGRGVSCKSLAATGLPSELG